MVGGIVPGASLINPPEKGKLVGKPAISQWDMIGGGNNVYTFGLGLSFAERFELYIAGLELANAFTELTDPLEQEKRFGAELDKRSQMGKRILRKVWQK